MSKEITDDDLNDPKWDVWRSEYGNWRAYVTGDRIRAMWPELPLDVRRAIAEDALDACYSDPRWDE